MELEPLKANVKDDVMDDSDVIAVGIGLDDDGNETVIVTVKEGKSATFALPSGYESQPVTIEEGEEFTPEVVGAADLEPQNRKTRHRPVPAGVSAGHKDITAGTASYILTDGDNRFPCSNNHVYANVNQGTIGDNILQPGPADGGSSSDKSGELRGYVEIQNGVTVDVAWITPAEEHLIEIFEYTKPKGEPYDPSPGDTLKKSGRTTGVTTGEVQQVNASVNVNFGDAGTITMEDQIITSDMSEGGDSGSATLHEPDDRPAGLLFAGSNSATVHNKASNVESETGFQIVTDGGGDGGNGGGGGETPTANVSLTLVQTAPETGNINVTVTDESGSGVQSATVSISGEESSTVTTDTDGVAIFTGVTIGSYSISASKDGYNDGSASITESDFQ
jgi:hypothetical protein